jgi:ABC-2 type transport system permease protein
MSAPAAGPPALRASSARAFLALCERDLWVTVRHEPAAFLSQALLQPLFFLFVFGRVLPEIGAAQGGYGTALLPGVMALTLVLTALQNTALPLVIEFSFTKEIEDRLLAPIPAALVGVQKLVWAAVRGIIAGLVILPLGELVLPGGLQLSDATWWTFVLLLVAGGVAGASIGLVMGTAVPANKINVVFAVVLTPLLFTGATFYPWQSLDSLRWF